MSWIEKLYQTYENNLEEIANPNHLIPLLPLFHSSQNAQLHVVLDGEGNFLRAEVVSKDNASTIIPATESSAGRAGAKIAPHALFDSLQYVAGDYLSYGGNPNKKKNESGFEQYIKALQAWVESSKNRKLQSVLDYLQKGQLINDLTENRVLFVGKNGKLAEEWAESSDAPPIFKVIKQANKKGQFEAFARFSVEIPGDCIGELWKDSDLRGAWAQYYGNLQNKLDICMVKGDMTNIASNHPKNIRYSGDGAKLISSNDTEGFTYLGRFTGDSEACGVGIKVTQKAHSALRWLIDRQGRRDGDQAVVAWAVSGVQIPDPLADTFSLLFGDGEQLPIVEGGYTAQHVGVQLSKLIGGYAAKLGNNTDGVVVMALDSATPGRMAIRYYRELTGSEFLTRVQAWHHSCCWRQYFGKDRIFVGAPAPRDIAETAYGRRLDDKLRKATVERLLPCIIDGAVIPRDLVESCVRRASNRNGIEHWEWEKALGIACALYKYHHKEGSYSMALDRERKTRDYLFGRLLALAEHLESRALYVGGEKRATNAEKLMQRFADRPQSTWMILETSLAPHKVRLSARRPAFLHNMKQEIDAVVNAFETEDFVSDKRLTGEFLLGYHCQRTSLRPESGHDVVETEEEFTE
jgi:CRISPR-associated protein Csd1